MIEAVENHMPEVIIIDEIGRELEAIAARTIAERGVQLIGTAHGNSLENLLMNPTLSDLVGGIESVTLSDEEARRRGTQKSVLERRAPPTFDVLIEIKDRQHMVIHHDVTAAVDAILRDRAVASRRTTIWTRTASADSARVRNHRRRGAERLLRQAAAAPRPRDDGRWQIGTADQRHSHAGVGGSSRAWHEAPRRNTVRIYPYGIGQNRLRSAANSLNVPIQIVDNLNVADAVHDAEELLSPAAGADPGRRTPQHSDLHPAQQHRHADGAVSGRHLQHSVDPVDVFEEAMRETQEGIQRVLSGVR